MALWFDQKSWSKLGQKRVKMGLLGPMSVGRVALGAALVCAPWLPSRPLTGIALALTGLSACAAWLGGTRSSSDGQRWARGQTCPSRSALLLIWAARWGRRTRSDHWRDPTVLLRRLRPSAAPTPPLLGSSPSGSAAAPPRRPGRSRRPLLLRRAALPPPLQGGGERRGDGGQRRGMGAAKLPSRS